MNIRTFAAVSCLGLLSVIPSAADQWNKKTYLTVNETISLPGATLEPGKYVMKLLESQSNRHIVQVFNEREDHLYTTILAIPNYRLQPTGKTEFQWWETPAGQPKALRAWFYPGDNFGQEFAYPKNMAATLATANNTNVPTTYAENEADLTSARVGTVTPQGTEMELDRQTYARQEGNQPTEAAPVQEQPTQVAQATPREEPAPVENMRARTLPHTASQLPLLGLAGFAALGASMMLRRLGSRA